MYLTVINLNFLQLYVHGSNVEEVQRHIPKEVLPNEYGGTEGTIQELINYWEEKYLEHRDFLMEFENYGTDESKRVGKPKYAQNLFGVEGSFRKLEVD